MCGLCGVESNRERVVEGFEQLHTPTPSQFQTHSQCQSEHLLGSGSSNCAPDCIRSTISACSAARAARRYCTAHFDTREAATGDGSATACDNRYHTHSESRNHTFDMQGASKWLPRKGSEPYPHTYMYPPSTQARMHAKHSAHLSQGHVHLRHGAVANIREAHSKPGDLWQGHTAAEAQRVITASRNHRGGFLVIPINQSTKETTQPHTLLSNHREHSSCEHTHTHRAQCLETAASTCRGHHVA